MKRWLVNLTIATYLGCLSWGIVSHALKVGTNSHPAMYFVVWDMFCGWSGWACHLHVIGEGASGQYYELSPGPWGEVKPFGPLGRRHYDVHGYFCRKFALNTLRHTDHEPIVRILVIEESWAKKYNLPDHIWVRRFEEPRDPKSYYHVRHVLTGDGRLVHSNSSWTMQQVYLSVADNPRLYAEYNRDRPLFMATPIRNSSGVYSAGDVPDDANPRVIGSPLGSSAN